MDTKLTDIIDRLNDPELYVDAVDDAIAEIKQLRGEIAKLRQVATPMLIYECPRCHVRLERSKSYCLACGRDAVQRIQAKEL